MTTGIKIMWINPLGYDAYDQPMADFIAGIKRDDTQVDVVSLDVPGSPNHLEYRTYEGLMLGDTIRATREAAVNDYDAVVIGCFYDPGIEDAREISGEAVVVAPCQASVQIAANLANRFSVIVGREKWVGQMTERVTTYGYRDKLASMRAINLGASELQTDCGLTISRIMEAGRRAIEEDGAEALLLGCTCNFGLYRDVQAELGVPVIDPICAAFKMAEDLAHMKKVFGWTPSRIGSCAPPPEEELASFGVFTGRTSIKNRVSA
ncbi:MAG: hydantoin racemase [Hyphomonadaceae bacterium]|nr:hydantoin racemase [Hyphomonadaceae bacterium]